jgi:hypothetical protein
MEVVARVCQPSTLRMLIWAGGEQRPEQHGGGVASVIPKRIRRLLTTIQATVIHSSQKACFTRSTRASAWAMLIAWI